jgi:hypothetical protein
MCVVYILCHIYNDSASSWIRHPESSTKDFYILLTEVQYNRFFVNPAHTVTFHIWDKGVNSSPRGHHVLLGRQQISTHRRMAGLVFALRPQTPKHIRGGWSQYTDTSEPVDGGVQLWTTRTILSVKMDREHSLTLLWPEWGSNPIPSDPQSASNRLYRRLGPFTEEEEDIVHTHTHYWNEA